MVVTHRNPRRRTWPTAARQVHIPGTRAGNILPYDHATSFKITGSPGQVIEDVINISAEGVFVAVAIGYGFEQERTLPLKATASKSPQPPLITIIPDDIALGDIPKDALITGFRVNPRFASFQGLPNGAVSITPPGAFPFSVPTPAGESEGKVLEKVIPPASLSFLFSMVDTATGRELQDEPAHNLASLGSSDGRRPFRPLARPMTFMPRSTLRIQIVERTPDVKGTLFIVLYGYKILAEGCAEPLVRTLRGSPDCPTESIGRPSARAIPFDYVSALDLTGRPGNRVTDEVPIHVDGGFVATGLGYGLESRPSPSFRDLTKLPDEVDLSELQLKQFTTNALTDGMRIRPNLIRLAFDNNGALAPNVPKQVLGEMFETLNRVEGVSFRYSILDTGTGRELQNQPIHNVAGLGIANGDRPFKKFARPMIFRPRSTIRVTVEEQFGRGRLFLVFQGYKFLGGNSRRAWP